MTRCVRDNAMLFDLLAGPDEMDSTSARISRKPIAPDLRVDVKGLRIGLPKEFFGEGIDPGVRACIMEAAQQYQRMGAQLVEVELPFAQYALPTYYIVSSAEASSNLARFDGVKYGYRSEHYDGLVDLYFKSRSEGFGAEVQAAASCWAPMCWPRAITTPTTSVRSSCASSSSRSMTRPLSAATCC